MYTDINDIQLEDHNIEDLRFRHDRKDIYQMWGQTRSKSTFTTRILYEIVEVNCNPDIDW